MLSAVLPLLFLVSVRAQTYSATYLPSNAPNHSEQGQSGTNQCGTGSNQTSQCQNAYINSIDDFCIFAPPEPGPGSVIGSTEPGYGTRLIPDGTVTGAHFVQTPDYVQVTGVGDFTKINIPKGDAGGELDPHGADGNGNPIGGLVFSSAFTGQIQQVHEWTDGPKAPGLCEHIYDVMGCEWNMPGNYGQGFAQCAGDSGEVTGEHRHLIRRLLTSSCTTVTTIGNSVSVSGAVPTNSTSSPTAPPTTSGTSATRTSSSASSTSSSNAASTIGLPGSGALVGLITLMVGASIF
ncbi:hypothetical protein EDB87DRAFT_1573192 [Lactarius vividus]|nr:hypothetical protein EDB87DRAFT_1573192 [Lactarius vividus]